MYNGKNITLIIHLMCRFILYPFSIFKYDGYTWILTTDLFS